VEWMNEWLATDGFSYFCLYIPMPVAVQDSVFPLACKELYLTRHGLPVWLRLRRTVTTFYDSANIKDHILLNGTMIDGWWVGEDFKGSACGLIKVLLQRLRGCT
jgi:hypothetical protein